MELSPTWLALGPFAAFAMSLYFLWHLWPYRDEPGGWLFIATIVCEAVWTGTYGLALMVFDPTLRWLLEIPMWFAKSFILVFFLGFVLEYTGRGELVRSKWMGLVAAIQAGSVLLVATNPLHHLAWSNYHIDPVFGAATVSYTHQPWLFVTMLVFYFLGGGAMVLLVEAFVSYGELYRGQTLAVALSLVAPFVANLAWLFELGPARGLNLTTTALAIHLAFDFYAFFRRNMFEQTPAARRSSSWTAAAASSTQTGRPSACSPSTRPPTRATTSTTSWTPTSTCRRASSPRPSARTASAASTASPVRRCRTRPELTSATPSSSKT